MDIHTKALAILAPSYRVAVDGWLRETPGILAYHPQTHQGEIMVHNIARPFIIVVGEDRLRGRVLIGFEVVGPVSDRLIDTARSRVRD